MLPWLILKELYDVYFGNSFDSDCLITWPPYFCLLLFKSMLPIMIAGWMGVSWHNISFWFCICWSLVVILSWSNSIEDLLDINGFSVGKVLAYETSFLPGRPLELMNCPMYFCYVVVVCTEGSWVCYDVWMIEGCWVWMILESPPPIFELDLALRSTTLPTIEFGFSLLLFVKKLVDGEVQVGPTDFFFCIYLLD